MRGIITIFLKTTRTFLFNSKANTKTISLSMTTTHQISSLTKFTSKITNKTSRIRFTKRTTSFRTTINHPKIKWWAKTTTDSTLLSSSLKWTDQWAVQSTKTTLTTIKASDRTISVTKNQPSATNQVQSTLSNPKLTPNHGTKWSIAWTQPETWGWGMNWDKDWTATFSLSKASSSTCIQIRSKTKSRKSSQKWRS